MYLVVFRTAGVYSVDHFHQSPSAFAFAFFCKERLLQRNFRTDFAYMYAGLFYAVSLAICASEAVNGYFGELYGVICAFIEGKMCVAVILRLVGAERVCMYMQPSLVS